MRPFPFGMSIVASLLLFACGQTCKQGMPLVDAAVYVPSVSGNSGRAVPTALFRLDEPPLSGLATSKSVAVLRATGIEGPTAFATRVMFNRSGTCTATASWTDAATCRRRAARG